MKTHEHTSLRRGIISALIGLALVVLLTFGASKLVGAQQLPPQIIDHTIPYISTNDASGSFMKRIGSLAVGMAVVPNWIINPSEFNHCTRHNPNIDDWNNIMTCLDVTSGTSSFAKLWVMQRAMVKNLWLGSLSGTNPHYSPTKTAPLIVEDLGQSNDSMLVSGLGRYNTAGKRLIFLLNFSFILRSN